MKIHYKPFLFVATLATLMSLAGCQEDEDLNLVKYPVNQPSVTIDNAENAPEVALTAIYQSDGTLKLNGLVSRTYRFRFAASLKDATVTFDVLATNIPADKVEISATKVVIPAGSTDASVTVTLKDENFDFAQLNDEAETYELGVKATVEGYQMASEPIVSKVVIKKEAYVAFCSVVGESGNVVTLERAYTGGKIANTEPMVYTFKVKLDKAAKKDITVKMVTSGLDEKFMKDVKVTPAEIVIPAGQLSTDNITWAITDDFLLETDKAESHKLIVTATIESDIPAIQVDKQNNFLTFNVDKVLRSFGLIKALMPTWKALLKAEWSVEVVEFNNDANQLIDDNGSWNGSSIYTTEDSGSFTVDMKSVQTLSGLSLDYYTNGSASCSKKIEMFTSDDNVTWALQGEITPPQAYNHYFEFFAPISARYLRMELTERWNDYLELTELNVYK